MVSVRLVLLALQASLRLVVVALVTGRGRHPAWQLALPHSYVDRHSGSPDQYWPSVG